MIETLIGHIFKDARLIEAAFTHRRASKKGFGYERLEFLGDRVLGMIVAEKLLALYPDEAEGQIALRYTALVSTKNLASLARQMNLGQFIVLGQGQKADVRQTDSVLADVFEALIAALYLDGGLGVAQAFIEKHFGVQMIEAEMPPINYKTALQEIVQKKGLAPPVYTVESTTGPDHDPRFVVVAMSPFFGRAEGVGPTKKDAEQEAAQKAYNLCKKKK